MRIDFTESEIKNEVNKFVIEEDDLMLIAEYIEGEGKNYVITGSAIIENEKYNDFKIEIELKYDPENITAEEIMNEEWEWYDYLC